MVGAHGSKNCWTLESQCAGMATPHRKTQRWSTLNEEYKRHIASHRKALETVDFGTPVKTSISISLALPCQ
ncbi:jg2489 [Pararge aegeria aegeria]|uniref:Jg2489 protein n=1 Tax=Pararge aegeria aegeria TaxID=348720 RepID=A0A8S4RU75_9NEOP|nr:jg2489 [Pararge aegeria aegeria]